MTSDSTRSADTLRKQQGQPHNSLRVTDVEEVLKMTVKSLCTTRQLEYTDSYKFHCLQLLVAVDNPRCSTKMKLQVLNASLELSCHVMRSAACIFLHQSKFLSEHQRDIWISITAAPRNFNQNI